MCVSVGRNRPLKIRDEADACAMDVGVVVKGDVVKVLEVRVAVVYIRCTRQHHYCSRV